MTRQPLIEDYCKSAVLMCLSLSTKWQELLQIASHLNISDGGHAADLLSEAFLIGWHFSEGGVSLLSRQLELWDYCRSLSRLLMRRMNSIRGSRLIWRWMEESFWLRWWNIQAFFSHFFFFLVMLSHQNMQNLSNDFALNLSQMLQVKQFQISLSFHARSFQHSCFSLVMDEYVSSILPSRVLWWIMLCSLLCRGAESQINILWKSPHSIPTIQPTVEYWRINTTLIVIQYLEQPDWSLYISPNLKNSKGHRPQIIQRRLAISLLLSLPLFPSLSLFLGQSSILPQGLPQGHKQQDPEDQCYRIKVYRHRCSAYQKKNKVGEKSSSQSFQLSWFLSDQHWALGCFKKDLCLTSQGQHVYTCRILMVEIALHASHLPPCAEREAVFLE